MKTRAWIALFAALLLVSCAAAWYVSHRRPADSLVGVRQDGRLVRCVDLALAAEPYDIALADGCVVRVEAGEIRMLSSDCPDQICVAQGALTGNLPIVCVPNRVVIRYLSEPDAGYDAVSGAVPGN